MDLLALKENMIYPGVFAYAKGDVTGDRIDDHVYLTGIKSNGSNFIQSITLVVQDGRSGLLTSVVLPQSGGYQPTLTLGDFTGNGVENILIGIATGGSGGTMLEYIYSLLDNQPQLLFDSEAYNQKYQYEVIYLDQYRVRVNSLENNKTYLLDISERDPAYLAEIYQADGVLQEPISGFVDPLSGFYPIDFDRDGVDSLLVYQRVSGRYHADGLGFILNTLAWNGESFALTDQNLAIPGREEEPEEVENQ